MRYALVDKNLLVENCIVATPEWIATESKALQSRWAYIVSADDILCDFGWSYDPVTGVFTPPPDPKPEPEPEPEPKPEPG